MNIHEYSNKSPRGFNPNSGMPLGLFKQVKVGKYRGIGGLVGVQGGEAPLKLELFLNQNCPKATNWHAWSLLHAKKKKKKKSERRKKSEFRQKSEKGHPC